MEEINKCEECKFSSGWAMTKHDPPRVNTNYVGKCDYFIHKPLPMIPKMAFHFLKKYLDNITNFTAIPGDDTPCPLWEKKL